MLSLGPGQGARGSSNRKEGPLSTPAVSRAATRRRPAPVSKVTIDTPETLRRVPAPLADMNAEATLPIALRGKSAIADHMFVTSGTSNRHVGSIAARVLDDLAKAGIRQGKGEGMPHCDWGL